MDTQFYTYLIVAVVLAVVALAAILRYDKSNVILRFLGFDVHIVGESEESEQPQQAQPDKQPSSDSKTIIVGGVTSASVDTTATGGEAITLVGGDVVGAKINTESRPSRPS
jgi:hypothetical protein